jgi:sporulation protein YlmC with PRC-barrel domain
MQLNQDATIFATDNRKVGQIDRVVINPKQHMLTHIVIRKGYLFNEDKVVPIKLFRLGQNQQITLPVEDLHPEQLPKFEEKHFVPLNEEELKRDQSAVQAAFAPLVYWYPPYPETTSVSSMEAAHTLPSLEHALIDAPAFREGMSVVDHDGKQVGNVGQLLREQNRGDVTHFILTKETPQAECREERKIIPIKWIDCLGETEIRLAVRLKTIIELPEYEPA